MVAGTILSLVSGAFVSSSDEPFLESQVQLGYSYHAKMQRVATGISVTSIAGTSPEARAHTNVG